MEPRQPRRIQVAKLPSSTLGDSKIDDDLIATLCYFYPQYTFAQAEKLSYQRISSLLKTARQQEGVRYKNLTQIAAAPHSKKGAGVKKLLSHYDKIIKNG